MVSCLNCDRTWSDDKKGRNSLSQHKSRHTNSDGTMSCISKEKKNEKRKAAEIIKKTDPVVAVAAVEQQNNYEKNHNKLMEKNEQLMEKMDQLLEENKKMSENYGELKEMVTEFVRKPQLLILVDKLYPLSSLRELDLKTPAFKPVLDILDNELPEYANLVQSKTGTIHRKAVRKLNEIQPTAVKDEEFIFYKQGDIITKADNKQIDKVTEEFIDVFANSGYEYAQKASKDLKSKRDSDKTFQNDLLQNARIDIQQIEDVIYV